jgi:hypothetical protein
MRPKVYASVAARSRAQRLRKRAKILERIGVNSCSICTENFDCGAHQAFTAQCGHSFCLACRRRLVQRECPICKTPIRCMFRTYALEVKAGEFVAPPPPQPAPVLKLRARGYITRQPTTENARISRLIKNAGLKFANVPRLRAALRAAEKEVIDRLVHEELDVIAAAVV